MYRQNIIEDLLHTYSSYIQMPLFIINSVGEIRKKINIHAAHELSACLAERLFKNILEIAPTIKSPSVVTSTEEIETVAKYVFSPLIHSMEEDYFILAGPFIEKQFENNGTMDEHPLEIIAPHKIPIIRSEEKITILNKVESLTNLFMALHSEENFRAYREKMVSVALDFSFLKNEVSVFEKLLSINDLDFLGYANKNNHEQFKIEMILGEQAGALQDQLFFIGEGLLGQAVASGKELYWTNKGQSKRAELFSRFDLFPQHLFCYPIVLNDKVNGLMFGGRFKDKDVQQEILATMKEFTHFLSEQKQIHKIINEWTKSNQYVNSFLDLIDVFFYSKDTYNLLLKVLYMCYQLNGKTFVCLTFNGRYFERGEIDEGMKSEHMEVLRSEEVSLSEQNHSREKKKEVVHLSIEWNGLNYGLLTTKLQQSGIDYDEQKRVLDALVKLLSIKCSLEMPQTPLLQTNELCSSQSEISQGQAPDIGQDQKERFKKIEPKIEIDTAEIEKISDIKSVIVQLPITLREQEILFFILEGLTNHEVAEHLNISPHTVKNHITNIFRKLNVSDRVQAMAKIYRIKYGVE